MKVNLNVYSFCHTYYQEIIDNPPESVEYTGKFQYGTVGYMSAGDLLTKGFLFTESKFDRLMDVLSRPSWRLAVTGDLVHSERLVPGWKPYVVSFDHVGFLTGHDFDLLYELAETDRFDRYLGADRCRRLLPWSEAAARSLRNVVGDRYDDKMEVLYPAVAPTDVTTDHDDEGPFELLFVSTAFDQKGGREALRAYDRLSEEFDVHMTVVSTAPESERRRYADEAVTFEEPTFSRQQLYEQMYGNADVLVHPTHNDSFGMVYLEAMNAGVPVVTTDVFAVPEIVADGETGFVVDRPETCLFTDDDRPNPDWSDPDVRSKLQRPEPEVVENVAEATADLLSDPRLRREFGNRAIKIVEDGRFSIDHRNEQLREIYDSCG